MIAMYANSQQGKAVTVPRPVEGAPHFLATHPQEKMRRNEGQGRCVYVCVCERENTIN